ncbi:hypothetical protein [Actinacidiphila glaucinigra]|uniref:hypothetical protein n=1 Tax=Actinacidiphila glaucinigra TaxID=235986 RepID=UPI00366E4DFC
MIKEGAHTFIDGQGAVVPYAGKYAVRTDDPFTAIRAGWEAAGITGAYRPLRVELEITDRCNDTCKCCGMGAKPLADGITLSDAQVDRLIGLDPLRRTFEIWGSAV